MTVHTEPPVPDQRVFRDVMGVFATGVAVVTTEVGGTPRGMTVNSLTSLSVNPPTLLVCLTRGTRTAEAVTARGAFVVNLLARGQRDLADRFARPGMPHYVGLPILPTSEGLPALPGCAGYLECDVADVHPGGDHLIVVGRVRAGRCAPASPLVYYRGRYHRLAGPGHDVLPFGI